MVDPAARLAVDERLHRRDWVVNSRGDEEDRESVKGIVEGRFQMSCCLSSRNGILSCGVELLPCEKLQ